MGKYRILVVDDEEGMLEVCRDTLRRLQGADVVAEPQPERVPALLESGHFDLLILDVRMPGVNGIDLLREARRIDPDICTVMITAYPSVEIAVTAMKLGAADFLTKPFHPEELLAVARRLLMNRSLLFENKLLERQLDRGFEMGGIVGSSQAMKPVYDLIERVAAGKVDVLIHGETGTGKELVARAIHRRSDRSDNRFVPVDCGAIPDELLESELFGHERGAFTGAQSRSIGLFEFADQGTFFLDEVAELTPRLQAKLLRVLQERRFRRIGSKEEIAVDVRVVAATARDLQEEVAAGRFRDDLFYRLNVIRVDIPPLRDRIEDIPLLASHFIKRFERDTERPVSGIDQETMDILTSHRWPGNVRELENVIRRAMALARGKIITQDDLPPEIRDAVASTGPSGLGGFFDKKAEKIGAFERDYFHNILTASRGDTRAAARSARLPLGTLYRLLKKHGIRPDSYRERNATGTTGNQDPDGSQGSSDAGKGGTAE